MEYALKNRIFLIDDSLAEPILLENAIFESKKNIVLETFDDSIHAVEEIKRRKNEAKDKLPNLILLDLNMHGYSGLDVLKILQADDELCFIPVVVMTSSNLDSDMKNSVKAGARSVLVKPSGSETYANAIAVLYDYWFETVKRIDSGFY